MQTERLWSDWRTLDTQVILFVLLWSGLTCKWGHAASNVGSSSSGSNSAPLGLDDGGNVLNKLPPNWKKNQECQDWIFFYPTAVMFLNSVTGGTVNLFNFASDLFSRYSRGWNICKNKSPQNIATSIVCNERRKANAKIYRRKMTFHQQSAKIKSCKNK